MVCSKLTPTLCAWQAPDMVMQGTPMNSDSTVVVVPAEQQAPGASINENQALHPES